MAVAGERFEVDLSSDEEAQGGGSSHLTSRDPPRNAASLDFIRDIKERAPSSAATPPAPPQLRSAGTGFPAHKRRAGPSVFKQQRKSARGDDEPRTNGVASGPQTAQHPRPAYSKQTPEHENDGPLRERERREIDRENKARLAEMSGEEIEQERQELLGGLNPSLIERLLRRANLDDEQGDQAVSTPPVSTAKSNRQPPVTNTDRPPSSFTSTSTSPSAPPSTSHSRDPDDPPRSPPSNLHPASTRTLPPQPKVHFPTPVAAPDLDPSSPSFLESLQAKYFPTLAADPSKLAWMAPITTSDDASNPSPYSPSLTTLPPSAIRFSFRGTLIPPRTAATVPPHLGLHHHGDAPEAAGYTIPELARLARSAYAAQRCVAFQTLGRILYRLGRGDFGPDGDDLVMGLWRCMDDGGVIKTLTDEAARDRGAHLSARAHAVEAIWNWQKGGGRRWKAQ
ncbi:MAG: hypothetical protein M1837_005208 [Sclerophora amabilis]|nr:MAG: hypothetical protein M1837_005208 [Sclerophora amabilis]